MQLLIHSLWQKITQRFNRREYPIRTFTLEGDVLISIQQIAVKEKKREDQVAQDLVEQAILFRQQAEYFLAKWKGLSPREQHVVALCCLGYNNSEIAEHLSISLNTVKSHIRNACQGLGVQSKSDLRKMLAEWDFSGWEMPGSPYD
jgi:ATP/maltotriose-dependent transcriptional regulator MalT